MTSRTELRNIIKLGDIYIYYAEQLKDKYDAIDGFNYAEIKLDKNVQLSPVDKIDFSILSTIKFAELKKILLTKDGKLKEQIFVENIRSFIGNTGVNQNIRETLDDNKTSIYFSFLNNGITIMCDSINKHPVKENTFKLMHPRIINGCQTTHILFDKFKENAENIDNIDIVAKIIATKDNELKKKIVLAANNQNSIDQDLQALNSFHEHIENYFIGNSSFSQKLYFERLRGQYSDVVPPHSKIGIETLARVYISVFMREPHKMKTNALTKIEEYQKDKKIFVETTPAEDYYLCAILYYYLQSFILNNALTLKTKTIDMHLLMVCNIVMEKKGMTNTTKKISYLSNKDNALSLFNIANNRLNKQSELFEKRGLYSSPKTHRLLEDIKTEEIDDAIE